jgi:hypothetical protein
MYPYMPMGWKVIIEYFTNYIIIFSYFFIPNYDMQYIVSFLIERCIWMW